MNPHRKPEKYGAPWTREELILAFDLYCRILFKKTKANNPDVIELANILKRSPASIARKLGNFGSLDPELRRQKVSGLLHTSKLDRKIWDEFHDDWNQLVTEAKQLKDELGFDPIRQNETQTEITRPKGPSEKITAQKTRTHQTFFREAILSSYENTCCITGLRIRECLVASHIIPWSVSEDHRTDPRNGLCLSATFDRLFDRGLIAITSQFNIAVSSLLLSSGDKKINDMICLYHGEAIIPPRKFLPLTSYLEWHQHNVFKE
jgi:putative restriction endonuclease